MRQNNVPKLKTWMPALEKRFGARQAAEIATQTRVNYQELLKAKPSPASRALQEHLHKVLLPGLALYQALRSHGQEELEAVEATQQIYFTALEKTRTQQQALGKLPFVYALYRRLVRPIMRSQFPESGFNVDWIEVSQDQIAFNMRGCFYVNMLQEYGAPELGSLFCNADNFIYDDMSPHIRFERTQTIAKGGEYCDFRFINTKKN